MSTYKPTRLYIKRHSVTGLRYFGKSVKKNIDAYAGSGKRWVPHIKKHGKEHVITEWVSDWFHNKKEIKEFALAFSEIFDIVESDEWCNMKPENGVDGGDCGPEARGSKKRIKTMNDPAWKNGKGKIGAEKRSKTMLDPIWQATIGKETKELRKQKMLDPIWQNTIGKQFSEKMTKLLNSDEWKSGKGKLAAEKRNKTMNDTNWRKDHQKICEKCARKVATHIYSQFHGNKCNIDIQEYYRELFIAANVSRKEFYEMHPEIGKSKLYRFIKGL